MGIGVWALLVVIGVPFYVVFELARKEGVWFYFILPSLFIILFVVDYGVTRWLAKEDGPEEQVLTALCGVVAQCIISPFVAPGVVVFVWLGWAVANHFMGIG